MRKNFKNFADFESKNREKKNNPLFNAVSREAFPICLFVFCAAIFLGTYFSLPHLITYDIVPSESTSGAEEIPDTQTEIPASESDIRIFREYGSKVGVFFKNGDLDFVIDTDISLLSEYDRELLSRGIIADGREEVMLLIEGLTGER